MSTALESVTPTFTDTERTPAKPFRTDQRLVETPAVQRFGKRLLDVAVAFVALVLLSPLLVAVAIVIVAGDRGAVLFRQERVGRDGRTFTILKFRTMCVDAEARLHELLHQNEAEGPLFKLRSDPRITRVGQFLRRTSIDELPQLWNVVRGDMSLVGPRPALLREVEQWELEAHGRLTVRPGITGPWQVNGRSDLGWQEGLALDLNYAANWSVRGDLVLLLRTIPRVLASRGAY